MNIYKLIFMILNYSWYILFGLAYFKLWEPAHNYLEIITFYFNKYDQFNLKILCNMLCIFLSKKTL